MVLVGPVRVRQEHRPAAARRARGGDRGPHHDRRPRREQRRARVPRRRDGVPVVRALPAHDGLQEPRLRAREHRCPEARDRRARPPRGRDPADERPDQAQAEAALRRAAAARRARTGDRARAGGLPDGRAALEPRREAARRDARRDPQAPAAARDDHHLRHARPGRGDDDGRPDRGHERAACCSRSGRRRSCTRTRGTCSSRASSARRR